MRAGIALGILAAAIALGRLAVRAVDEPTAHGVGRGLLIVGLGLGAASHAWLLVGVFGGYRPAVAITCVALGVVVGGAALARGGRSAPWHEPERPGAFVVAFAGYMLAAACVPAFSHDALTYHANVAKLFVREGRLVWEPTLVHAYPLAGEMFYVWGLLLGAVTAGTLIIAAHGVVAIAAIARLGRRIGGEEVGRWSALIVASMTAVWHFALEGKTDLVLLMHVALALSCYDLWRREGRRSALVLSAAFIGFGASSKLTGAYTLVALIIVCVADVLRGRGRRADIGVFTVVAVVIAAPWYVRTWVAAGDPLWPALFPLLGGVEGTAALYEETMLRIAAHTELPRDASGFLVGMGALAAGAPSLYGRSLLGPLFLTGLPLLALRREAARGVAWLLLFAAATYAAWFTVIHAGRHFVPALAALAPAAALGLAAGAAHGPRVRRWVRASLVVWASLSLALALSQLVPFVPYLVGRESRDAMLARVAPFHEEIVWMNAHLPRDAVVASELRDLFYLDRRSIWVGDFQAFVDTQRDDPAALAAKLARRRVSHLFLTTSAEDGTGSLAELARRCGEVVRDAPNAVLVESVTLRERVPHRARVVALRSPCPALSGSGR